MKSSRVTCSIFYQENVRLGWLLKENEFYIMMTFDFDENLFKKKYEEIQMNGL